MASKSINRFIESVFLEFGSVVLHTRTVTIKTTKVVEVGQ